MTTARDVPSSVNAGGGGLWNTEQERTPRTRYHCVYPHTAKSVVAAVALSTVYLTFTRVIHYITRSYAEVENRQTFIDRDNFRLLLISVHEVRIVHC